MFTADEQRMIQSIYDYAIQYQTRYGIVRHPITDEIDVHYDNGDFGSIRDVGESIGWRDMESLMA